ncbi:CLUMA_CG017753, isoform A [Clunio marinus]|uniref:CLUMA_CG017753, isoform A n=1 Tax=Clunio marinus TaxID=568069 RepID=A0A1J1J1F8_9DIPT|nr:CLUMA_CG017753, isoform A [Clunio marinus]
MHKLKARSLSTVRFVSITFENCKLQVADHLDLNFLSCKLILSNIKTSRCCSGMEMLIEVIN